MSYSYNQRRIQEKDQIPVHLLSVNPPAHYDVSFANKGLLSSSPSVDPFALASPFAFLPSLRLFISHIIHITNRPPCRHPVTTYVTQLLHLVPSLLAKLMAHTNDPGVWMHIIGMLRLPTCFSVHVVYSCGMYWSEARIVDWIPRKFAHATSCGDGAVEDTSVCEVLGVRREK